MFGTIPNSSMGLRVAHSGIERHLGENSANLRVRALMPGTEAPPSRGLRPPCPARSGGRGQGEGVVHGRGLPGLGQFDLHGRNGSCFGS